MKLHKLYDEELRMTMCIFRAVLHVIFLTILIWQCLSVPNKTHLGRFNQIWNDLRFYIYIQSWINFHNACPFYVKNKIYSNLNFQFSLLTTYKIKI